MVGSWSQSFAQQSNSTYLEIGRAAGHYSINYERVITQSDHVHLYGSIGFSPRIPMLLKFRFAVTRGLEIEIGGGLTPIGTPQKPADTMDLTAIKTKNLKPLGLGELAFDNRSEVEAT